MVRLVLRAPGSFGKPPKCGTTCSTWVHSSCSIGRRCPKLRRSLFSIGRRCDKLKHSSGDHFDATTGQLLQREVVKRARQAEMVYLESRKSFERSLKDTFDRMGKAPIPVMWVDTNKGDDVQLSYGSRFVALDISMKCEDSIFAHLALGRSLYGWRPQ